MLTDAGKLDYFAARDSIRDNTRIGPTEKAVALEILACRNSTTAKCYPGHASIAKKTGLSKRTVERTIPDLVKKGILCIEEEATYWSTARYVFTFDEDDLDGLEHRDK